MYFNGEMHLPKDIWGIIREYDLDFYRWFERKCDRMMPKTKRMVMKEADPLLQRLSNQPKTECHCEHPDPEVEANDRSYCWKNTEVPNMITIIILGVIGYICPHGFYMCWEYAGRRKGARKVVKRSKYPVRSAYVLNEPNLWEKAPRSIYKELLVRDDGYFRKKNEKAIDTHDINHLVVYFHHARSCKLEG